MWEFLDSYRNWIMAFIAFVLWVGAFTWYFTPMIRKAWRERLDEWTKD